MSDESAQNIGQIVQMKAIEVQKEWSQNVLNGATIAALTENYASASVDG